MHIRWPPLDLVQCYPIFLHNVNEVANTNWKFSSHFGGKQIKSGLRGQKTVPTDDLLYQVQIRTGILG